MGQPDWAVDGEGGVDRDIPNMARAYDYALGGVHNFAVDREFVRSWEALMPNVRAVAQATRSFMHRAVRFMVDSGIRQLLDIGSGIPTVGNVHEIAQAQAPEARVVYVDIDPIAVAHSNQILAGNDLATAIQEDLRRPEMILNHPATRALLDLDQPLGLILSSVLHAIPDQDDPHGIMTRLREALCPGSYLVLSHATADVEAQTAHAVEQLTEQTATPVTLRSREEIMQFFRGFDLVEPGVVWTSQWRPYSPADVDDPPGRTLTYAGVGRR